MVPRGVVVGAAVAAGFESAPHRTAAHAEPTPPLRRGRPGASWCWWCSRCRRWCSKAPASTGPRSTCATCSALSPFVAGLAVAIGAFAQGATRFLRRSVSSSAIRPVAVARVLLGVLAAGTLLVFVRTASPGSRCVGFALIGMGTSVIFPLAMSAAAQRTDRPRRPTSRRWRRSRSSPSCSGRRCWALWPSISASAGLSARPAAGGAEPGGVADIARAGEAAGFCVNAGR